MFEVTLHDRRIAALRAASIDTLDEVRAMGAQIRAAFLQASGLVIATADFRGAQIFKPEVTEGILAILKADNPQIERSGHLLGGGALVALQIERLVREAGSPRRKTFRSLPDIEAYLGEVLTPSQRTWLHEWYEAGAPAKTDAP